MRSDTTTNQHHLAGPRRSGFSPTTALAAGVALLILAIAAFACGDGGSEPGDRLRVVTTLELFADMVREVGGDRVDVKALLPSGADPHTYELAPAQVADIARSDLAFGNGLDLEGTLLGVVEENAGGVIIILSDGFDTLDGNPHLWLDATLAAGYVERIRDALIERDPDGREAYGVNAALYLTGLREVDNAMAAAIASVPPGQRKLVTFHDAFPYLAARYGLEIVAVVVPSPGQEPSARDIAELTEILRSEAVPAAFKEPQFNAEVLELAADEAGVDVFDLLSDAYIDGVDSYLELMRFNLRQLREGLGGN